MQMQNHGCTCVNTTTSTCTSKVFWYSYTKQSILVHNPFSFNLQNYLWGCWQETVGWGSHILELRPHIQILDSDTQLFPHIHDIDSRTRMLHTVWL